jgi:hypothetical protein
MFSTSSWSTRCLASIVSKVSNMSAKPRIELYSPQFYSACVVGGAISCGVTHTAGSQSYASLSVLFLTSNRVFAECSGVSGHFKMPQTGMRLSFFSTSCDFLHAPKKLPFLFLNMMCCFAATLWTVPSFTAHRSCLCWRSETGSALQLFPVVF